MKRNCENCKRFYECDNMGFYEECLPDMKYHKYHEPQRVVTDIIWDYDDNDEVLLPTELSLPEGMTDIDEISNWLSDLTGYCNKGFTIEDIED